MKKFRKLTAMVSALVLAGCMVGSFNAFADGDGEASTTTGNSITINSDVTGHEYQAYQIFKGTYLTDSSGNKLLAVTGWGSGIDNSKVNAILSALGNIEIPDTSDDAEDDATINPFDGCETAEAVAKVLSTYIEDTTVVQKFEDIIASNLSDTYTKLDETKEKENEDDEEATITTGYSASNLADGYYLVKDKDDSLDDVDDSYTKYIVDVAGEISISPKNGKPTLIKKVKENKKSIDDGTDNGIEVKDSYNDVADYNIGDDVPFRLYVKLPDATEYARYDTYYLEIDDTLDDKFDAPTSLTVKIGNTDLTAGTDYTYVIGTDHTIKVYFANTKAITSATADSVITVDYTAKLNKSAEVGNVGQENFAELVYSNNPNASGTGEWNDGDTPTTPTNEHEVPTAPDDTGKTPQDKVVVFTYELDLNKVDGDGAKLSGASFTIQANDGEHKDSYLKVDADGNITWTSTEPKYTSGATSADGIFTSDGDKLITIKGLDDGKYTITEVNTPNGYNGIEPLVLNITADTKNTQESYTTKASAIGTIDIKNSDKTNSLKSTKTDATAYQVDIVNQSGLTLPSTGGIGTTVFYLSGGVLVVGAGVTLIAKKRMKANK